MTQMSLSLPSRERGLKCYEWYPKCKLAEVAPFAGAWIEMENKIIYGQSAIVAPFAGAWIEIA